MGGFCAYFPVTPLTENTSCFLTTNNSRSVWEGGGVETESLLSKSLDMNLLGGDRCRADAQKREPRLEEHRALR